MVCTNGFTFEQIGATLGGTRSAAFKLVQRGIGRTIEEPAQELRTLQLERLDEMLSPLLTTLAPSGAAAHDGQPGSIEELAQWFGS